MTQTSTKRERLAAYRRTRGAAAWVVARKKQRIRLLLGINGAVLGIGALVLVIVLFLSRQNSPLPIGVRVADEGAGHVADGTPLTFKHYPPASGKHYPSPASAGFSDKPIAEGNFVHSMEHGYIVILYKPSVDSATVQQLRNVMTAFPKEKFGEVKLVISPYDKMDSPITVMAWDRQLSLNQFDQDQLLRFYQAYVDHGPEDVP